MIITVMTLAMLLTHLAKASFLAYIGAHDITLSKQFALYLMEHFAKLSETADHLYEVEVDKDELWNLYLDSFPAGTNEIYQLLQSVLPLFTLV